MAGGTGGHVFPALALARMLREKSVDVVWLGTQRGLEARIVPAAGIPIEWLSVGGLRGKGVATLLAAPFKLALALTQALRVMWRHRPVLVVGLGGFVTGPGGVAAWLTGRPLVIHEQNAVAGFTKLSPTASGGKSRRASSVTRFARTSARCRRRPSGSPLAAA
jgi:UDP-N-acetylglucosamine--N-acetylmuramyl-(pentapeptide) pyrophosphoryl-undecaprenol N-acetylglucosamine transferase